MAGLDAYEIAGVPGPVGTGTVEIVGDRYLLGPSEGFAFSSLESSQRTLKTEIDGVPSLLIGHVFVFDGVAGLRIDEARIGTDDPNEIFTGVAATFELLESLCTWRYEDGAARPASVPLRLPEIAATPAMSLGLDATGLAVIRAVTATSCGRIRPTPISAARPGLCCGGQCSRATLAHRHNHNGK
jgi:hypothetical protein